MIKIHELLSQTARLTVEYQSHTIEVEYYPNRVTPEFLSSNPGAEEQIIHLVKWWSIEEDDGTVDVRKTVYQLPVQLLTLILEKLIGEMSLRDRKN
jgi:hypothetical protein